MNRIEDKLPQFNRDVVVFNCQTDEFDIDKRVKGNDDGEEYYWCWLKSDKRSITHWVYAPSKPRIK